LLYQKHLSLRNDCSNNLNISGHVPFMAGKTWRLPFTKNRKNQSSFIRDEILKCE